MLKKRLIGVVTVLAGWAVQSIGYKRYLPIGKPECVVENLDRWGVDEIVVLAIDRTRHQAGPDFELVGRLARLGISTPLIYGGGIRSVADGVKVTLAGADRLTVDALLQDNPDQVRELATRLGAQAIIGAVPISQHNGQIVTFDYRTRTSTPLKSETRDVLESGFVSEVLLIDWKNEGTLGGFNSELVDNFLLQDVPLIVFGGITTAVQIGQLLQKAHVSAVAVGNSLNYREHAVQKLKSELEASALRPSVFETKHAAFLNV
jgi:imidazole glycerol-phosphate synthase subunit HisF